MVNQPSAKIGRNEPCPCGSGKKFKACCAYVNQSTIPAKPDIATLVQRARHAVAQRNITEVLTNFQAVLAIAPNNVEALAGLGQALCRQERTREGLGYLRQAAKKLEKNALKTRDIRAILELAEQLHHWGDLETSVRLTSLALKIEPDSAVANNNLALYLSRLNRIEEAMPFARKSCQLLPADPAPHNLLAIFESRLGHYEDARLSFEKIITEARNERQTARAWQELATVLDKQGDYDRAFEACCQAKRMQAAFPEFGAIDRSHVFSSIARNKAGFDRHLLSRWRRQDFNDSLPTPVFLMGFLRSGTTLTEQVLNAHPKIMASDENSLIHGVIKEIGRITGCGDDMPAALRVINLEQAHQLRQYYWHRVQEEYGSGALAKCFVNKVALNSIDIGLIATLFPEAKILFALRDPRDVCISCYMQTFQPSTATINMLDWVGTAKQYAAVMDLWLALRADIAPMSLELRYEDTVNDFEQTFRRVFELLDLEWAPEVSEYRKHAKGRYIATPSFAAVTQPIYKTALQRWTNYQRHFVTVEPILKPFVQAFGYESSVNTASAS